MQWTLFKKTWKSNYKTVLIFMAILSLYFCIIAGMYDPDDLGIVNMLAEMKMSPELLSAMGFTLVDSSLTGFLASYYYGFLMLAFPLIYYIITANKIVAGLVERGAMAYVLSTPTSRKKVVVTQAVFLMTSVTVLIGFITLLGIGFCEVQFPGLLDIQAFLLLNFGLLLLHFAISGICFFASCVFNESRTSLLLGAGLPVMFLLIQMLANAGEKLSSLKYFTIYTLFNANNLIQMKNCSIQLIVLFVVGAVLYSAGIMIFDKKDLPI
ncbi:MAG: ABC transporter permease subunit [Cellulosilyticaceae bacterium]